MAYIPDISHWKPVQNWGQVKESCPFIISKATQGTNFIDPYLDTFIKNCEAQKIPYWLYTFLNAGNELAQAQYMVSICETRVGSNFVGYILDVEQNNPASGVKAALDYINSLGGKTMIYTMYSQYNKYKDVIASRGSNCAWWEARYGKNNGLVSMPCHNGVDLHQYTSKGRCIGIAGDVDLNRIMAKDLSFYTGTKTPEPEGVKEMQGTIIKDGKVYYYNIETKQMWHVPNPDALKLLAAQYKASYGKNIPSLPTSEYAKLVSLIKAKSV